MQTLDDILDYIGKGSQYSVENPLLITGKAGTGKTYIINKLFDALTAEGKKVYIAATTNPAVEVLRNRIKGLDDTNSGTVHRVLGIKAIDTVLNVITNDFEETKPFFYQNKLLPQLDVLFVDEASMLKARMIEYLKDYASYTNCVIIYVGDAGQLSPVTENNEPPEYPLLDFKTVYTLTINYRQKDPILQDAVKYFEDLSPPIINYKTKKTYYRYVPMNPLKFKEMYCDNSAGKVTINEFRFTTFINGLYAYILKKASVKVLCFENADVDRINNEIAKRLLEVSGVPVGIGTLFVPVNSSTNLTKHSEYEVIDFREIEFEFDLASEIDTLFGKSLGKFKIPLYKVLLKNKSRETSNVIIYIYKNEKDFANLVNTVTASNKNKKDKQELIKRIRSTHLLNPVELKAEGKYVTSPVTLKYGYASTIHMSQGSQYANVFVNYKIISKEQYNQLLYVGVSRATETLHLFKFTDV